MRQRVYDTKAVTEVTASAGEAGFCVLSTGLALSRTWCLRIEVIGTPIAEILKCLQRNPVNAIELANRSVLLRHCRDTALQLSTPPQLVRGIKLSFDSKPCPHFSEQTKKLSKRCDRLLARYSRILTQILPSGFLDKLLGIKTWEFREL